MEHKLLFKYCYRIGAKIHFITVYIYSILLFYLLYEYLSQYLYIITYSMSIMHGSFISDLEKAQASIQKVSKALRRTEQVSFQDKLYIPVTVFQDRRVGVLEATVIYLKDEKLLSYTQIAEALNRDDRTIWTSYHQGKKKKGETK